MVQSSGTFYLSVNCLQFFFNSHPCDTRVISKSIYRRFCSQRVQFEIRDGVKIEKRNTNVLVNQVKQESRCQDGLGKVLFEVE